MHLNHFPIVGFVFKVMAKSSMPLKTFFQVRKMAAQIIGNMYSLTDQKDLSPYLPSIIPGLKASLLDPVPKVRSLYLKKYLKLAN